jgi:N utilization substance protein A
VVPDQFSLAIGRGGQNVRLAAELTGWGINVVEEGNEEKIVSDSDDPATVEATLETE